MHSCDSVNQFKNTPLWLTESI